ncbi:MAG: PRC-barrel domain-containing protein [Hyphomicrobiaceae bacterium]
MRFTSLISATALVLASSALPGSAQSPSGSGKPPSSAPAPTQQQAKTPPKPVDGLITMQSDNTVLASNLIGAQVTGADGEGTAEISDVIVKTDGTIDGVVISVGGFLGLGAHSVAVKWNKIRLDPQPKGKTKLSLSATREDLKAAAKFKSKDDVVAEREAEQKRSAQPQRAPAAPANPATTK